MPAESRGWVTSLLYEGTVMKAPSVNAAAGYHRPIPLFG